MSQVKIRKALELALDAMVGFLPSVAISASASGTTAVFTSTTPHLMPTGTPVSISGHSGSTPDLNGSYFLVAISGSTFSLVHKVTGVAIASTAGGTGGVLKANLTAWEGVVFKPLPGVPYQRAFLLPATPDNPTYGGNHIRETGILQVNLCYPNGRGTLDVTTRAELIKTTFPRGASFENGGVVVKVLRTPTIFPGAPVDESYVVPVRIPYQADVFN